MWGEVEVERPGGGFVLVRSSGGKYPHQSLAKRKIVKSSFSDLARRRSVHVYNLDILDGQSFGDGRNAVSVWVTFPLQTA